VDVNKAVVIGIVGSGIIIGIFAVLAFNSFSILENNGESSEPILEKEDPELEPKLLGRDLSIELDEKMGLSAP
jgi:hypothetical protein